MITDLQTNTIYFSDKLKLLFPNTCNQIIKVLKSKNIETKFLTNTNDIWVRDFMPIQISKNKFIEYRYDPDYLQTKKHRILKSYPDLICESIGLKTIKTDLIIDGGNIVKSKYSIILTEKIFSENNHIYSKDLILSKLKDLFEIDKIIIIPWDKNEIYGHADGMVRFIDNKTVLIQKHFDNYHPKFKNIFYESLAMNGIKWEKLEFNVENENENNWGYLNFLQTKDIILLPSFEIDEDEQALNQIRKHYNQYSEDQIIQIKMNEIIRNGGALNCISWTIKK